jgi:hypothetical protein
MFRVVELLTAATTPEEKRELMRSLVFSKIPEIHDFIFDENDPRLRT